MRQLALLAIRGYQRFISPYKGFHCAFHAHTGRHTCSGYGYRVIARYGVNRGYRLLQRRLHACSEVYQQHHQAPALLNKYRAGNGSEFAQSMQRRRAQRGNCDVGSCDVGGCDVGACSNCGDALDLVSKGGDCLNWFRRLDEDDRDKIVFMIFKLLVFISIIFIFWYLISET